jgi:hypothetical protein
MLRECIEACVAIHVEQMRDKVLEEFQFSVAVVLSREEVVPRFRII